MIIRRKSISRAFEAEFNQYSTGHNLVYNYSGTLRYYRQKHITIDELKN